MRSGTLISLVSATTIAECPARSGDVMPFVLCQAAKHARDADDERFGFRATPYEVLSCALVVVHSTAEQGEDVFDVDRAALLLGVLPDVLLGRSDGKLPGPVDSADLLDGL